METLEKNQRQEENVAEKFEETPRAEIIERVKAMLTPEEAKVLNEKDFDLIIGVAQRYLEKQRSQTIEDALVMGTIARTEAREKLGDASFEVVQDEQGAVVATGKDRVDAMRKAQDATGK